MQMNKMKLFGLLAILLIGGIFACSDPVVDDPTQVKEISFYLTDCPFEADEVNVEILLVSVKDEDGSVIDLNTNSGIYNLLDFQDGVDTLIASGNVDFENIKHVYFELGTNNTIVVEGISYPLQLLKPNENVVKVKIDLEEIHDGDDYLVDFYACTSIIEKPNGYFLKPVIKFKGEKDHHDPNEDDFLEDLIEKINKCYSIEYPINFITENGSTLEANSDEEVIEILTENDGLELQFPINVVAQNGNVITLENVDDVKHLEGCHHDDDENEHFEDALEAIIECYEFVFPVSFLDEDGMEVTANNLDEVLELVENVDLKDFVYPFTILKENGNEWQINHAEMLKHLDDDCEEEENEHFDEALEAIIECYEFVFPVSFINEDGVEVTANNLDEVLDLKENGNLKDFVYPFTILKENGTEWTIMEPATLEHLDDDCDEHENEHFDEAMEAILECFEFVFPISFIDTFGAEVTANNLDEVLSLYAHGELVDFVYPFDVLKEGGSVLTINHSNMLNVLTNFCDDDEDDDFKELFEDIQECFEIVFPIKFNGVNGNIYTANNGDELHEILEVKEIESIIFPITLIDSFDVEQIVHDMEELEALLEDC